MNMYSSISIIILLVFTIIEPTTGTVSTSTIWPPVTTDSPTGPTQSPTTTGTPWPTRPSTTSDTPWPTQSTTTDGTTGPTQSPTTTVTPWPTRPSTTSSTSWPTQSTTTDGTTGPTQSSTTSVTPWPTRPSTVSSTASSIPTTGSVPNITTVYSNSLTTYSPTFSRPFASATYYNYYYQAIQVTTLVSGYYNLRSNSSIDTFGYLYAGTFDPSSPTSNLIAYDDDSGGDQQFSIYRFLSSDSVYILVVTTYNQLTTGAYFVIATGSTTIDMRSITPSSTVFPPTTTSSSVVVSNYSNSLDWYSGTFVRPYGNPGSSYYYQAIQVYTYTSSQYNFRSSSSIDTFGCLYNNYFDPSNPYQNLITYDDDSGGSRQFSMNSTLLYNHIYVLVVTTYSPTTSGYYSVLATGPGVVYMSSITPTTGSPMTTTTSQATSTFSDSLDYSSGTFIRPYGSSAYSYYYEAINVYTYTSGYYSFQSSGTLDAYGCLYSGYFDPSSPYTSLISCSYNTASSGQFVLNYTLPYATSYILVVTTYNNLQTGYFVITATGPATVSMYEIVPTPATTTPSQIISTYSNTLNDSSSTFVRPNGFSNDNYYYQAVQLTIYQSAYYSFQSISTIDTYGCLYSYTFDPSYPSNNLIQCNDDGAGSSQFLISQYLDTTTTYILVVTTYGSGVTGDFTVQATGPTTVGMTSISPSGSSGTWSVLEIIALSIACSVVVIIIIGVCMCRRKRLAPERQRLISPNVNRNRNAQQVLSTGPPRNASQFNGYGSSFTVIPVTAPPPIVEEAPPSYEAFMANAPPPPPSSSPEQSQA